VPYPRRIVWGMGVAQAGKAALTMRSLGVQDVGKRRVALKTIQLC